VEQLEALTDKGCRVERLLCLLVRSATTLLAANPHYGQLLQGLLTHVQMGKFRVPCPNA